MRWVWLLLAAVLLASCTSTPAVSPSPQRQAADRQAQEQRLLDQRARAVREDDRLAFLRTVDRSDRRLLRTQRRLFANLEQLPLRRFGYRVGAHGGVAEVVQLAGYDAWPVQRGVVVRFGRVGGRLVVTGYRPGASPFPWELTRIHVRRAPGVLGVFDGAMWPHARAVVAAVAAGRRQVATAVPFAWHTRVVVYSFAGRRLLSSFRDVPGGRITHLGAMTFPVYSAADGGHLAAMRFTLLPSSVRAGQPFLGRIIRHELTHVAVGSRDDGDPTWLSEGIAEYVGARPIPPSRRRIPAVAVREARSGVTALPSSKEFNGPHQEWNYALAWMACDYIASTSGEAKLWQLMAALHADGRGTPDSRQDAALRRVLGYDSHELARRAAARILAIYG